jgi:carbonic anhydrase
VLNATLEERKNLPVTRAERPLAHRRRLRISSQADYYLFSGSLTTPPRSRAIWLNAKIG